MSGSGPTRRIDDWKPPGGQGPGGDGDRSTRVNDPNNGGGGNNASGGPGGGHATQIPGFKPPGGAQPSGNVGGAAPHDAAPVTFLNDPVVGWLVIVKGPGQGMGLRLGVGMNAVGRGEGNRVVINYGDKSISRDKHCIVTYEPKQRVYFIQNEGGQNLTYVGEAVVLQAQRLHNGERIQMGETELRFVALCGEDFSWDDVR